MDSLEICPQTRLGLWTWAGANCWHWCLVMLRRFNWLDLYRSSWWTLIGTQEKSESTVAKITDSYQSSKVPADLVPRVASWMILGGDCLPMQPNRAWYFCPNFSHHSTGLGIWYNLQQINTYFSHVQNLQNRTFTLWLFTIVTIAMEHGPCRW